MTIFIGCITTTMEAKKGAKVAYRELKVIVGPKIGRLKYHQGHAIHDFSNEYLAKIEIF